MTAEISNPVRVPICYVKGTIGLKFLPPDNFAFEPVVEVDGKGVKIASSDGGSEAKTWKYVALVEKGDHKVKVSIGNVSREVAKNVPEGDTASVDFDFFRSQ